jgi:hypothetical protein
MSPVQLHRHPTPVAPARRVAGFAGAIVVVLALAGLFPLVRGPEFVDHVSIDNRSSENIEVSVHSGDNRELPLAAIDAGERTRIDAVLDQGDDWNFVFRHAGETVGEARVTRDQLASDDWRIVIPGSDAVDGS